MKQLTLTLDDATYQSAERQAQKAGKALTTVMLEWLGRFSAPTGEASPQAETTSNEQKRQKALEALRRLSARGGIGGVKDPAAWQREQRADRSLPGRES